MEDAPAEPAKPKAPVFRLHFTPKILAGKSYVRTHLPLNTPHTVAGKFYQPQRDVDEEAVRRRCEELVVRGPKEKYRTATTENQLYGWYEPFSTTDRTDRRLHFARRHDHTIKLHLQTLDPKPTK